jgi:septum formation protein
MIPTLLETVPPDGSYDSLRKLAATYSLVLASQSPRRRELLANLGIEFEVARADVDEAFLLSELPSDVALRLAASKSLKVSSTQPEKLVIGCDTVVILGSRIMDKPKDRSDAARILRELSGKRHQVETAVTFSLNGRVLSQGSESTQVRFMEVTDLQIEEYVATGEPMDKAGAYGIQGMGGFLVDSIEGRLDTVVGLPRTLLDSLAEGILSCHSSP